MKSGLVSVFIPSYNYARYLGEAIDSILAQTYEHWELIIVDDASSDDSPALIERYCRRYPERIRATLLKENVGQSESTNIGLGLAQGEFISLLAADDVARPDRLKEGVALLRQRPELAAVFSKVGFIDGDGRPLPEGESLFNRPIGDLRWQLLEGNFLCGTSIVARLSAMKDAGSYNRTLGYVEDYDLWLRLLDRHELLRVDNLWVDYRLHGANLSLARSAGDIRYGTLYESVAVAIRAMHRWPADKLHRFTHRPGTPGYRAELASLQVRLARCCLALERNFLDQVTRFGRPSPGLGVAAAYGFLLDALQQQPGHAEAQALLKETYGAMGDTPRARGDKSATLSQLSPLAASPLASEHGADDPPPPLPVDPPVAETGAPTYTDWCRYFELTRVEAQHYDRLVAQGDWPSAFIWPPFSYRAPSPASSPP